LGVRGSSAAFHKVPGGSDGSRFSVQLRAVPGSCTKFLGVPGVPPSSRDFQKVLRFPWRSRKFRKVLRISRGFRVVPEVRGSSASS
jgi:hypothetical protein